MRGKRLAEPCLAARPGKSQSGRGERHGGSQLSTCSLCARSNFAVTMSGISLPMLLLSNLLTKFIQTGTLRVFDSRGRLHRFGDKAPGPTVTLRLHDRALETKLALSG